MIIVVLAPLVKELHQRFGGLNFQSRQSHLEILFL